MLLGGLVSWVALAGSPVEIPEIVRTDAAFGGHCTSLEALKAVSAHPDGDLWRSYVDLYRQGRMDPARPFWTLSAPDQGGPRFAQLVFYSDVDDDALDEAVGTFRFQVDWTRHGELVSADADVPPGPPTHAWDLLVRTVDGWEGGCAIAFADGHGPVGGGARVQAIGVDGQRLLLVRMDAAGTGLPDELVEQFAAVASPGTPASTDPIGASTDPPAMAVRINVDLRTIELFPMDPGDADLPFHMAPGIEFAVWDTPLGPELGVIIPVASEVRLKRVLRAIRRGAKDEGLAIRKQGGAIGIEDPRIGWVWAAATDQHIWLSTSRERLDRLSEPGGTSWFAGMGADANAPGIRIRRRAPLDLMGTITLLDDAILTDLRPVPPAESP